MNKRNVFSKLVILISLLMLTACAGYNTQTLKTPDGYNIIQGKPEWVYNPGMDGKTGGVGISKIHVSGEDAQRNLAISRAIDMLARQKGVTVNNVLLVDTKVSNSGKNSRMESTSHQTVDGVKVNAEIKSFWKDPVNGDIAVWVVEK